MIYLHFGVKQLIIRKIIGVLQSFVCNYVKYVNVEGFCRDSHINTVLEKGSSNLALELPCYKIYRIWECLLVMKRQKEVLKLYG